MRHWFQFIFMLLAFLPGFAQGKIQLLSRGRLISVMQRENGTNGFNWTAIFDALGRRLRTTQTPLVNGVANSVMTLTLDSNDDWQLRVCKKLV